MKTPSPKQYLPFSSFLKFHLFKKIKYNKKFGISFSWHRNCFSFEKEVCRFEKHSFFLRKIKRGKSILWGGTLLIILGKVRNYFSGIIFLDKIFVGSLLYRNCITCQKISPLSLNGRRVFEVCA